MKGKIRNMYPGGNTPDGFHSYYSYILPQRKAKKIFCLKGGPGVGKSTLMKRIGEHFADCGEDVDFLWCSSDPDSLDGVLIRDRNVAVVDGTAPHIVDPKNPGAVDEIVNLGEHWDQEALYRHRDEIIGCGEEISRYFEYAYEYLKCAQQQYMFMEKLFDSLVSHDDMKIYESIVHKEIDRTGSVSGAEERVEKSRGAGKKTTRGVKKKAFATAITPGGIKNHLPSIISDIREIIVVDVPLGFRADSIIVSVSERFTDAGFDVEEYYCPMFPEEKAEHAVCRDAGVAVITCSEYHDIEDMGLCRAAANVSICSDVRRGMRANPAVADMLEELTEESGENITRAVKMLKQAKSRHDTLEEYYAPNMDFSGIEEEQNKIIAKIERLVL